MLDGFRFFRFAIKTSYTLPSALTGTEVYPGISSLSIAWTK